MTGWGFRLVNDGALVWEGAKEIKWHAASNQMVSTIYLHMPVERITNNNELCLLHYIFTFCTFLFTSFSAFTTHSYTHTKREYIWTKRWSIKRSGVTVCYEHLSKVQQTLDCFDANGGVLWLAGELMYTGSTTWDTNTLPLTCMGMKSVLLVVKIKLSTFSIWFCWRLFLQPVTQKRKHN